ncbi:hypothetical protein JL721_6300 [Aureococcus anophagefferens]|nr:hypothetical protein JL721_6300 [Aureococcus anophagefferens]
MASFATPTNDDDDDDDGYFDLSDMMPSWSEEERAKYLASLDDDDNEMPLLAESLDEMDPALVEGLMQLRDGDDPPSALAAAAKDRGNAHFQRAVAVKNKLFYREAAKAYTEGFHLCLAAKHEAGDEEPLPLKATLLSNRAACSLVLKNYGSAIADCKASLAIDGQNAKCCFRLARACLGLKAANKAKIEAAKLAKYAAVFDAAEAAGVRLAPSPPPGVHAYDSHPHFEGEGLRWPVVFCYPEAPAAQPDLLESVPGTDLLCDWLLTLFPEPGEGGAGLGRWRVYRATEVSVYTRLPETPSFKSAKDYADYRQRSADGAECETLEWQDAWLEVSPAATFADILSHPHYAFCGVVSLHVRPAKSELHAGWRADLEKRRKLRPLQLSSRSLGVQPK